MRKRSEKLLESRRKTELINIYRTDNRIISEIDQFDTGAWVKLTAPSLEECAEISDRFHMDIADVRAALDDEESSRINLEDEYTLILVDIPSAEMRNNRHSYTTIPLGILIAEDVVITVCAEETAVLRSFVEQRVRDFSTKKQMRFTYQILYNACMVYQSLLRSIDRKRTEIEERIDQNTEDVDLIDLHELESNLVYFATSLRANGVVLDRLTRYGRLRQYSEDQELLEDVIIENRQAIEMTQIYRDIINGTRELMSTVINNRLNNVMKYLAAITIVMSIPTIISGLWGMNVGGKWMPFSSTPHGFAIICVITLLLCIVVMLWLRKKKML